MNFRKVVVSTVLLFVCVVGCLVFILNHPNPTLAQTASCVVSSSGTINKRQLPTTSSAIAGTLNANAPETVNGQILGDDGLTWWRLNDGSWVRSDIVTTSGDCSSVPEVTPADPIQFAINSPGAICVRANRNQLQDLPQPDAQLIILDRSGSMVEATRSGETRMNLAREVITQYISTIPDGTNVGLRAYGFGNSCTGSQLLYPPSAINHSKMISIVEEYATPEGTTPIAYSLQQIPSDLADFFGNKEVLLVTDGSEQCNGDPVAIAESLAAQDEFLSISVIGFDIQEAEAQQNLRNIPQVARGTYVEVETEEDFLQAMSVIIRLPFEVNSDTGQFIDEGLVNRMPVLANRSSYSVNIPDLDISDVSIFVESGRGTAVVIDADGQVEVLENDRSCAAELCPNVPLPRLTVGSRGRVNEDDPGRREARKVRVRNGPGVDNAEIGRLEILEEFEVLDGPICADGFLWWEVRNERFHGWSAEGVEGNYFVEPLDED